MRRILSDPDHDAVIRIGSEAPKQRSPILFSGMEAICLRERPLPRIFHGGSSLKSACTPKLSFLLLFVLILLLFTLPVSARSHAARHLC